MTTQITQRTTDQITVRVTLDAYDFAHPSEKQTQVYVQIPDVARVSYMLPNSRYHGLKDRAWPEVLDVAQEHYAQGWVIDPSSAVARQAVMEWLRDPTNRDEMQAAYDEDQARRHPMIQELRARLTELEAVLYTVQAHGRTYLEQRNAHAKELLKLRPRVAELEADREASDREYEAATARIAELEARLGEYERPADEDPIAYVLADQGDVPETALGKVQAVLLAHYGELPRPDMAVGLLLTNLRTELLAAPADGGGYPPALPWARQMDADDVEGFLADLANAASGDNDLGTLDEVESAIARWRMIGEAQHAHNTAPGPDADEGLSGPCDCGEGAVHYTTAGCPAAQRAAETGGDR